MFRSRMSDTLGAPAPAQRREDALLADFLGLEGVMSADDLVLIARVMMDQPLSHVARAIVEGRILTFTCRTRVFAPRFQFGARPLEVSPPVRDAMGELESVREGNDLAAWFVEPNCWLGQRRPCAVLPTHPGLVLAAARGDRRIACGW
jgi:hypothetical protein